MEKGVITPYFTGFYFTLVVNEGRGSIPPLLRWSLLYPVVMEEGVITPYFAGFYFILVVDEGGSLPHISLAFTLLCS